MTEKSQTPSRHMTLFLDALRYSFQMAEFQIGEIDQLLPVLEETESITGEYETTTVRLALNIWGIIDVGHRIRELIQQLPGLKKNTPEIQIFLRATEAVEDLRHYIQHLRTGIHTLPEKSAPLWGVISWVSEKQQNTSFTVLTGLAPDISVHSCSYDTCKKEYAQKLILSVNDKTVEIRKLKKQIDELKTYIIKLAGDQGYSFENRRLPVFKFTVPLK
jgi:hypothetical protein